MAGDQLVPAHSLTAPEVRIEFQRLSSRMIVQLDVANTSATRCALEVQRGGRRVASVGFEPSAGTQAVPVPFVPASDRGVLTLVARLGDLSPPLIFFAVQIDDH